MIEMLRIILLRWKREKTLIEEVKFMTDNELEFIIENGGIIKLLNDQKISEFQNF
jgi:hypothetical protein